MTNWAHLAERGGVAGLRLAGACYRLLGERATRLLLYPVVAYFLLTGSAARRASVEYFTRLAACAPDKTRTPRPGLRTSYRHMLAFAESGMHKLAAWLGHIDHSRVDFPARAEFDALLASGRGALFISAHFGNLEMMRALAAGGRLATINAVVYTGHAQRFRRMLAQANARFAVNLLEVPDFGPHTAIVLKEKVDRGELVVMVGDRTPPADGGRVCVVDFLGAPAPFAQGPFILAAVLECPVYLFLCPRESDGYRIHLERFADRIELPRAEREDRLREHVQRYAHRLQEYCLRSPYQWFNFYDYWTGGGKPADPQRRMSGTHAR
jgi:predicted LPLAT superfamily acyltransferase